MHILAEAILSNSRASALLYAHEGMYSSISSSHAWSMFRTGARHLYLLDFDGSNLPELRKTIISQYPDVKVLCLSLSFTVSYLRLSAFRSQLFREMLLMKP
jgi:hypothetical protein